MDQVKKLTKAQAEILLDHAKFIRAMNKNMRLGQAITKLLQLSYPSIYKEIQGTDNDPFYSDELIEKCLNKIT